jgi:ribokinase
MPRPAIAVVGSSNTDMTVKADRIPKPGETVLGGTFVAAAGGKGANQAVGAARAGGNVEFVGRMGCDGLGDEVVRGLARAGVGLKFTVRDKVRPSGVALIIVGAGGENSIAVAPGANAALSAADIRKAARILAGADIVLLQLEIPLAAVAAAADLAAKGGARIILNPAPARPLPGALLKKISILTPNEVEAERLTGIKVVSDASAAKAARALRAAGVETVIITRGPLGAFVASPGFAGPVRGFKMKAVDTTGAGDIFNGALAVAVGEGRALRDAVLFAHAAAAISVTRRGAQPSAPRRGEIDEFLRKRSKEVRHG